MHLVALDRRCLSGIAGEKDTDHMYKTFLHSFDKRLSKSKHSALPARGQSIVQSWRVVWPRNQISDKHVSNHEGGFVVVKETWKEDSNREKQHLFVRSLCHKLAVVACEELSV